MEVPRSGKRLSGSLKRVGEVLKSQPVEQLTMRAPRSYDEQVSIPYLCPMVSSYFRQSAPQEVYFKFKL